MATSALLREELTCSVCLELYTDPHQLKCLHIYCLECLQNLKRNKVIQCPECRQVTSFKDIKQDFKLCNLADISRNESHSVKREPAAKKHATVKCEMCEKPDKVIICKCLDCEQFMCSDCRDAHRGMKLSRGHQVQSVADVTKALNNNNKDLKDRRYKVENMEANIDRKYQEITVAINNIKTSQDEQLTVLNQYKQEMMEKIEEHCKQIEKAVKSANDQLLQSLNASKILCEQMKQTVKSTQDFLSEMGKTDDIGTLTDTIQSLDLSMKRDIAEVKSKLAEMNVPKASNVEILKKMDFDPSQYVTVSVKDTPMTVTNQLSPLDYSMLCNKRLTEIKKVKTGVHYGERIQLINDQIWCAMGGGGVKVYSKDCDLVKTITHANLEACSGITQTHAGDLIISCYFNRGLHQLSPSGGYIDCIASGSFSDVCTYGEKVYALEGEKSQLHIFEIKQSKWACDNTIHLQHTNSSYNDKFCIRSGEICVSLYKDNSLCMYNIGGKFLYKTDARESIICPVLCDMDSYGNILVCSSGNIKLQVYCKAKKEWNEIYVKGELYDPTGAVLDLEGKYMWSTTVNRELIKYSVM